jgi:DNA polymerase III epsilon subunit-like protein
MTKLFSENIIFFDTEFTSLDPNKAELISIGLVKFTGEELYVELDYSGEASEWVKAHVLPFLSGEKISSAKAVQAIRDFVGDSKPYSVGYISQDDTIYWQKLFMTVDSNAMNPFHLVAIDFATILFSHGIDPEAYFSENNADLIKKLGIDRAKYNQHNALDDARLLRETYLKFISNPELFTK